MAMRSWVTAAALLVLLVPEACSSDSSDDDGSKGGSSAQGGSKASGGAAGQSTAEAGAPVGEGGRGEQAAGGSAGTGTSSAGSENAGETSNPQGGAENGTGGTTHVTSSGGENSAGESNGSGGHEALSGGTGSGGGTHSGGVSSGGTSSGGPLSTDAGAGGVSGLDCSPGNGLALICEPGSDADSGWIDGSGNCLGIQGAVYTYADKGGSDMYFSSRTKHICVAGTAKAAIDADHWGAIVSIQLNNQNGSGAAYDATAHGFKGMEFTLSGNKIPSQLYAQYRVDGVGSGYCKTVGGAGTQSVLISEAHYECWDTSNTGTPNKTLLTNFEIEVPSNSNADVQFDFCIDDLKAIE